MSWADDFLRQQQGAQAASFAAPGANPPSVSGGFISSAYSGLGELFGQTPSEDVSAFRGEHPYLGIGSQLLGMLVPYAGELRLTQTARGAELLGSAMETIPGIRRLNAVDNPILHAAAKEVVRYAPVEIARLGVGLGTTDSWHDYGNLFADVGLSTLITGGFGGLGGFFRVGGKTLDEASGVAGAPIGLRPTFELRMSKTPDAAPAKSGASMVDIQNQLMKDVFTERPYKSALPGQKQTYVTGLEGGDPETDALMNQLFKPSVGDKAGVQRLPMMDQAGNWALDDAQRQELIGGLKARSNGAITSVEDMAENMVFPRLVTVNSARAAGTVSKALDDSAMQWVSDGVMAGKEREGGLHVMAVRLRAGEAPTGGILAENAAETGGRAEAGAFREVRRDDAGNIFLEYTPKAGAAPVPIKMGIDNGVAEMAIDQFGTGANKLGPAKIREAMGQLQEMYPEIKSFAGFRRSGAGLGRVQEIKAPLPSTGPKIAQGDQWMLFKTDRPQLFAKDGYRLAQDTVNQWAKFREAWRPSGMEDFANKDMDMLVNSFTPQDFKEAVTLPKETAKSRIAARLAGKFSETAGLDNSATIKNLTDHFYDIMVPTVVNERRNPLFARLFGALRSATRAGDTLVNRFVSGNVKVTGSLWTRKSLEHSEGLIPGTEPIAAAIGRLTPQELQDFYHIGTAQAPKEALADYTANGLVSENLQKAVDLVQNVDRFVWENHLMPAFKNANLEGKFDLLEGYVMPRLWTGDWFAPVVDEHGNLGWLANGTRKQAMHQAGVVVEQAAKVGRKLEIKEPYMLGAGKPVDQIGELHDLVQMQIGKDAQMQEIVQRAMKKIAIDRMAEKPRTQLPRVGPPKSLMEERSGVPGSADIVQPKAQDIIKAIDNHYKQLFRFAATSAWRQRFMGEAGLLEKQNKVLFHDLIRKQNQIMGYEGQVTATLNKTLAPVLGHFLGGKPATRIATATNELLYDWNLAILNPTFGLLNVLQPIQTTLPHLAFLLRAPMEAIEADMNMTLRYGADGLPREVVGVLSPARILGKAMKSLGNPSPELMEHLSRAKTEGTLSAQLFEGWVGGQSRGLQTLKETYENAGGGAAGAWEFMKRGATLFAERSEEVSRAIAFNSYYHLGKEYFGLEGDKLYRFASRGTHNSMFGYGLIDRSRMFTGPVGSMFGLFKNWQMHFIASMFQYANLGWKHGTWAPLIWQFGAAGALGGLGAMGPLKWVADGIASWQDGSPNSYLWMQDHWHDAADEIYFGLPAMFGASLQASSTMPGTDVRNDLTSLSSFVFLERAKAAGKATGAAWDYASNTGQDPLRQGNIRDGLMQAFAPRALFRAFASAEGDYIKSMSSGYPQVRDVSPLSKFFYGMGLNQVEVERQQVAARELWKDQQAQRATIQQMGIQLADAQLNGDFEEMQRISQAAMLRGVPVTSVFKSANTRLRREKQGDVLSRYKGELAAKYKSAWEGD